MQAHKKRIRYIKPEDPTPPHLEAYSILSKRWLNMRDFSDGLQDTEYEPALGEHSFFPLDFADAYNILRGLETFPTQNKIKHVSIQHFVFTDRRAKVNCQGCMRVDGRAATAMIQVQTQPLFRPVVEARPHP